MKKRWLKLCGDTRTNMEYDEFIGKTWKKLQLGDTIIKKVLLFDNMAKKNRESFVMLNVIAVDDDQYDLEVV